ncbi:regulatory protein RecX [Candidatus Omnitrophota bacterium]
MKKDLSSAKKASYRLLKIRPRSEYELRNHLKLKGFQKDIIDSAITELHRIGLLDDLAFAKLWVESRIKRPLGLNRLSYELKVKGVAKDIINQVISKYDSPGKEEDVVRELINRKIEKIAHLDKTKIKSRLWSYFLRKGFSKDIVYDVLSEL